MKCKEQILSSTFVSNNLTFVPAKAAAPSKPSFSNISQTLFGGPHYSKAPEPDYLAVLDDDHSLMKSAGFHQYSNHNLFWPPQGSNPPSKLFNQSSPFNNFPFDNGSNMIPFGAYNSFKINSGNKSDMPQID
jgi:hypothetical protein